MEASWLDTTRRLRGYVVHRLPRLVVPVRHRAGGVINIGEESVSNLYTGFAVHFLQISYHSSTSQVWSPLLGSARGEIEIRWEVRRRSADSDCSAVQCTLEVVRVVPRGLYGRWERESSSAHSFWTATSSFLALAMVMSLAMCGLRDS